MEDTDYEIFGVERSLAYRICFRECLKQAESQRIDKFNSSSDYARWVRQWEDDGFITVLDWKETSGEVEAKYHLTHLGEVYLSFVVL